jgi:AcrR family transcriptional regulator
MKPEQRDSPTARVSAPAKGAVKRRAVRSGRPSRELAGEVDERILQAARQVFLERGLAGASIDEIAARARAGKPTIYARFPGKEALFTEVAMRNVASVIARFETTPPTGATIEDRLVNVGVSILEWILVGDTVDLMRVSISEARRFPDLASHVHRMAHGRGEEFVSHLLSELAQSDAIGTLPAFAPERLATTTKFFMNLVAMPLILRALFGEKLKLLHAEIEPHVRSSVAFFLTACRYGGVS